MNSASRAATRCPSASAQAPASYRRCAQQPGSAGVRHEPDGDEGLLEKGRLGCDDEVAGQRDVGRRAERGPLSAATVTFGLLEEPHDDRLVPRPRAGRRGPSRPARSRKDPAPTRRPGRCPSARRRDVRVCRCGIERGGEVCEHCPREGVELVGRSRVIVATAPSMEFAMKPAVTATSPAAAGRAGGPRARDPRGSPGGRLRSARGPFRGWTYPSGSRRRIR